MLFQVKTRVSLKYFVSDCLWKPVFDSNTPQTPSSLISLTILVTLGSLTLGIAATDKGSGRWLFLQVFGGILNATLSEKASTTGATHKNLELVLLPNFLDSH